MTGAVSNVRSRVLNSYHRGTGGVAFAWLFVEEMWDEDLVLEINVFDKPVVRHAVMKARLMSNGCERRGTIPALAQSSASEYLGRWIVVR